MDAGQTMMRMRQGWALMNPQPGPVATTHLASFPGSFSVRKNAYRQCLWDPWNGYFLDLANPTPSLSDHSSRTIGWSFCHASSKKSKVNMLLVEYGPAAMGCNETRDKHSRSIWISSGCRLRIYSSSSFMVQLSTSYSIGPVLWTANCTCNISR